MTQVQRKAKVIYDCDGGLTPIWSSSFVPASFTFCAVVVSDSKLGMVDAKNWSKIGSPTLPLPGHCVCNDAWGQRLKRSGAVKRDSTMKVVLVLAIPSTSCWYAERPRAG